MKGDKDQELFRKKGGQGWPHLVLLDPEGDVLVNQVARTVAGFLEAAKKAKGVIELREKADKGDPAAQYEYLLHQIAMRSIKAADARKKLDGIKNVTEDQKKRVDGMLVDLDVLDIANSVTKDEKTKAEAGKKLLEMKKAGRIPAGDREFQTFHMLIMDYCENQNDADGFEASFTALKDRYGAKMNKQFAQRNEERLRKLKEGK